MSIQLTITHRTRASLDTRWLRRHLIRALALLKIKDAVWSITIVNDAEMITLHDRTMRIPTTTDVLTFDLRDAAASDVEGCAVELDTVLCRDEAIRRATDHRHGPLEELLLYAIHSLLHVQGYDDRRKADAARMHRREDALLIALGVGAVYAPPMVEKRK